MPVECDVFKELSLSDQTLAKSDRRTTRQAAPGSRDQRTPPSVPTSLPLVSGVFLALLSGVLLALTMPPFDQPWLMWVGLVPWILSIHQQPLSRIIGYSYTVGFIFFCSFWYSVWPWGLPIVLGVCLSLPLFFVGVGLAWTWVLPSQQSAIGRWFLLPIIWVSAEYVVTEWLHFPMTFALTQARTPHVLQSAAWLGPYGISALMVLVNMAAADLVLRGRLCTAVSANRQHALHWLPHAAIVGLAVINLAWGTQTLRDAATPPRDHAVDVAILQPATESRLYTHHWVQLSDSGDFIWTVQTLTRLLPPPDPTHPSLIVWPEGGNGFYNLRVPWIRQALAQLAVNRHTHIVMASMDLAEDGREYNSLFWVDPSGHLVSRYDKRFLVPIAEGGLTAGTAPTVFRASFGAIGSMICAESNFPDMARSLTRAGASLLLISSSDASFRRSSLAFGHTGMAILRAIESRRPVILNANIGPSMLIDPYGRVRVRTGFWEQTTLTGSVTPVNARSVYHRIGFCFAPFLALLMIGLLGRAVLLRRAKRSHQIDSMNTAPARGVMRWPQVRGLLAGGVLTCVLTVALCAASLLLMNQHTHEPLARSQVFAAFAKPLPRISDISPSQFRQATTVTCGSAALAYLLSIMGRETNEEQINRSVRVTPRGINLYELKQATEHLGFQAWGERQNYQALQELPKPVIAHVEDDHYVVVTRANRSTVEFFDPALGRHLRMAREVFESAWQGIVLIVRPRPIPIDLGSREPVA